MKQTLFLGIAAILDAVGAFLSSIHYLLPAYSCFAFAILMVLLAIWVTYREGYRRKRCRDGLGSVLVELSECESEAYRGSNKQQYDRLIKRIDSVKLKVAEIAKGYADLSIESRFLAVRVLDVQLDEATKLHFTSRAQGDFWAVYQLLKGWRACVEQLLQEIPPAS